MILYEARNRASDITLVDNELSPGQKLRNESPLTLLCGNGCEDGAVNLTSEMAVQLRDALSKWLELEGCDPEPLTTDRAAGPPTTAPVGGQDRNLCEMNGCYKRGIHRGLDGLDWCERHKAHADVDLLDVLE